MITDEKKFFLTIISRHAAAIDRELRGVRANRDSEPLHRMRVALRRLKTTLSDFKEILPSKEYGTVRSHMNKLLRTLGPARDMDTKLLFLRERLADSKAARFRRGLVEIIDEISEDRQEVQPKIMKNLARYQQHKVAKTIARWKPALEETGITLDEWAKNRILVRLEKLITLEPYVARPGCLKELHEMRITAKNLRYTLENLQTLYGRRVKGFATAAMRVQQALGAVHNFDVWINLVKILSDSSGRDPGFRAAVAFLRRDCEIRRERAYREFVKLWRGLKRRQVWARLSFFAVDRS